MEDLEQEPEYAAVLFGPQIGKARAFAQRLAQDPEFQGRINRSLRSAVVQLVDSQREQLSGLIATTVAAWPTATLVDRLELMVGRDLQFIRINGTLVGGLVGLVLYLLFHT